MSIVNLHNNVRICLSAYRIGYDAASGQSEEVTVLATSLQRAVGLFGAFYATLTPNPRAIAYVPSTVAEDHQHRIRKIECIDDAIIAENLL